MSKSTLRDFSFTCIFTDTEIVETLEVGQHRIKIQVNILDFDCQVVVIFFPQGSDSSSDSEEERDHDLDRYRSRRSDSDTDDDIDDKGGSEATEEQHEKPVEIAAIAEPIKPAVPPGPPPGAPSGLPPGMPPGRYTLHTGPALLIIKF